MAEERREQQQKPRWTVILIYLGLAGVILYASLGNIPTSASKHVSYSEFLAAVEEEKVGTVRVTNSELIGILKSTDQAKEPVLLTTPRLPAIDESWLMQELRDKHIQIVAEPQTTGWWSGLLSWLFPILMILFFYSWMARSRIAQSGLTRRQNLAYTR
jgi:ATP-dependent Zn protease